jgi:hypothetical protein
MFQKLNLFPSSGEERKERANLTDYQQGSNVMFCHFNYSGRLCLNLPTVSKKSMQFSAVIGRDNGWLYSDF